MEIKKFQVFLVDNDTDDCMLFKEVVEELALPTELTIFNNCEMLIEEITKETKGLPDVLFLDLNLPRKNGFECLLELKCNEKLKQFPVIIFSTSYDQRKANLLYENGAHYYIQKPEEFADLKNVISLALTLTVEEKRLQPPRENFVLMCYSKR